MPASYGEIDELGAAAVTNRLHVKNLHAMILNRMELDSNHLNYFYGGLGPKLVAVEDAEPIHEIFA